eukprot:957574-Pelagomonas_calceolata.AAC.1
MMHCNASQAHLIARQEAEHTAVVCRQISKAVNRDPEGDGWLPCVSRHGCRGEGIGISFSNCAELLKKGEVRNEQRHTCSIERIGAQADTRAHSWHHTKQNASFCGASAIVRTILSRFPCARQGD